MECSQQTTTRLQIILIFLWYKGTTNSHFVDEPVRQVNLDFVLASANGLGFSFAIIRISHTRITPSDDAEAKMLGVSEV